jgi:hypothetical protein
MNSKREGKYFQFPIKALRVGCGLDAVTREQAADVFEAAIGWSIMHRASKLETDEQLDELADAYLAVNDATDSDNEAVRAVAASLEKHRVHVKCLSKATVKAYGDSWKRIERIPGAGLLVRVRTNLMFEMRDTWSFRDAAILCGVYAGVGGKVNYKRVTAERIRTLASGFASGAELCNAELTQHGAQMPMLTDRQVRWTLGKLERRGFFQSATPTRRCTYYSHRLSEREFIEVLAMREKESIQRKTDTKRAAILARAQELLAADAAAAMQSGGR